MRVIVCLLLSFCFFSMNVYADIGNPNFAVGCRFKNRQVVFNGSQQPNISVVYLIKNISNAKIGLDIAKHAGASAGYGTVIEPQKWSALVLQHKNFNWVCQNVDDHWSAINCSKVIRIRRYLNQSNRSVGNYWLAENQDLETILNKLKLH